ncbi:MAG: adenine phosphoribosyltransferase [Victivallales bacterium]|nr:adenine phosphoribosyltransferase [Victivallales bacterium]
MSKDKIAAAIRDVRDFPCPGIVYKDITPLLKDAALFAEAVELMAEMCRPLRPSCVAAVESRGFIFGAALALQLQCGFVPVRKKGKLPYHTLAASYELEYGEATIEVHRDAVQPGERVVLVDDVLATGGTARAAAGLLRELGGEIVGVNFLLELSFLNGREQLQEYRVSSLLATGN